jgi:hypothetical protein
MKMKELEARGIHAKGFWGVREEFAGSIRRKNMEIISPLANSADVKSRQ